MKFRRCLIGVSGWWPLVSFALDMITWLPALLAPSSEGIRDTHSWSSPICSSATPRREEWLKTSLLLWHADDAEAVWAVEYQTGGRGDLATRPAPHFAPHRGARHRATPAFSGCLGGLGAGEGVCLSGAQGMERSSSRPTARAPKGAGQPYRFVSFGDCGAGTAQQKAIAYQTFLARPDFLMITGDIVYSRGRISEYREKFWPAYNADRIAAPRGAALAFDPLRGRPGQP